MENFLGWSIEHVSLSLPFLNLYQLEGHYSLCRLALTKFTFAVINSSDSHRCWHYFVSKRPMLTEWLPPCAGGKEVFVVEAWGGKGVGGNNIVDK